MSTKDSSRAAILDDELIRVTPGIRDFSVGILRLCKTLGLDLQGAELSDTTLDSVAWLLDERHSLDEVKAAPNDPDFSARVADYAFDISPAYLMRVKAEVVRQNLAVKHAMVEVMRKPGDKPVPVPEKKS